MMNNFSYYVSPKSGEVFAYDEEQIDGGFVKDGLELMSREEVEEFLNPQITEEESRRLRDTLLMELDKVVSNPLRYESFSPEERDSLADYRRLLLEVPQQKMFPKAVVWPEMPAI